MDAQGEWTASRNGSVCRCRSDENPGPDSASGSGLGLGSGGGDIGDVTWQMSGQDRAGQDRVGSGPRRQLRDKTETNTGTGDKIVPQ